MTMINQVNAVKALRLLASTAARRVSTAEEQAAQTTGAGVWATACAVTQARGFSSRIVDMMTLPTIKRERVRAFQDVKVVGSTFLKNRILYQPQFTPHGVQLVPKVLMEQGKAAVASPMAATPLSNSSMAGGSTLRGSNSTSVAAGVGSGAAGGGIAAGSSQHVAVELAQLRQQLRDAGLRLQALRGCLEGEPVVGDDDAQEEPPVLAGGDRTKQWRKLKMKKHKISKRRKLIRHRTK